MVDIFDEYEFMKILKRLSKVDRENNIIFPFTANHFILCSMIGKINEKAAKFYVNNKVAFKKEDVKELIEQGYIKEIAPNNYDLYNFKLSEILQEDLILSKSDFEEFFNAFPKTFVLNGKITSARNVDYDKLETSYIKITKKSKHMHNYIMEATERYKKMLKTGETNPMGIDKFINARNYETYIELSSQYEDNSESNFNVL